MHPPDPDDRFIDWQAYIPTDIGAGWDGVRSEPPVDAAREEWERWRLVREAVRYNNGLGLSVDRVRQIQRRIRPDHKMTSLRAEFDPLTVIALMWFQHDHGLGISGVVDTDTSEALASKWRELGHGSVRKLLSAGPLVGENIPALHRFLYYRQMILEHGGLFDDRHREANVLMLRDAELCLGSAGFAVRYTGSKGRTRITPWVTVTLWLERAAGDDDGDVVGVSVRERPGHSRPVSVRRSSPDRLDMGQYVCDLEGGTPQASEARGLLRKYDTSAGAIPVQGVTLPAAPGVHRPWRDPPLDRLTHGHFVAELEAMRTERQWRDGWRGVRVMVIDASKLEPAQ